MSVTTISMDTSEYEINVTLESPAKFRMASTYQVLGFKGLAYSSIKLFRVIKSFIKQEPIEMF
jgi:hypothetical protein